MFNFKMVNMLYFNQGLHDTLYTKILNTILFLTSSIEIYLPVLGIFHPLIREKHNHGYIFWVQIWPVQTKLDSWLANM